MDNKVIAGIAVGVVIIIGVLAVAGFNAVKNDNDDSDDITYYGNGGTYEGRESYTSTMTDALPCMFTNDGKNFVEWNTKADGSGSDYLPGSTIPKGSKLYAQWSSYTFTIANINYLLCGMSMYITDETRQSVELDLVNPLSANGMAVLSIGQWESVQVRDSTSFSGTLVNGTSWVLTINLDGADTVELSVTDDGKMAMIAMTYHSDVTYR